MTSIEGGSLALPTAMSVGSEIDLAGLAESYSALLFRVAHSILRSQSEAEDVVQDVFVRVIEHRRKLPEVRDMRVWLVRIAWNLALDRKRRIRPEQFDEYFVDSLRAKDLPADKALAEAREMQVVLQEIDKLPKAERSALLLSAMDELQTTEIAAVMGKSESAVRALIFRARTRLRERIQKGAGYDKRG
jgi:RNA polymerase sigma-70 factor (ECF subfamily)